MREGSYTVVHIILEIPSSEVLRATLQAKERRDVFHNTLLACIVDRFIQHAKDSLVEQLLSHFPDSQLTEYTLRESGIQTATEKIIQVALTGIIAQYFSNWFCSKLCKRAQQEGADVLTDFAIETEFILPEVCCEELLQVKKRQIPLRIDFPRGATIRFKLSLE